MLILNTMPDHGNALTAEDAGGLDQRAAADALSFLESLGSYQPTPLTALPGMARETGIASIHVKDEGKRLGLGSFKALGGAYAVARLVLEAAGKQLGRAPLYADLKRPEVRETAKRMTFACATDGNHGRSVAWGAEMLGAAAVIFVHEGVSGSRIAAIARYGARIIRVSGNYDDSVAEATRVANENGWTIVSDTSWPGYERIPAMVMQGYTAMVSEALDEMTEPPTHVFIQAGVGGLAAAVAGHFALRFGKLRPKVVVVEPSRAACFHESTKAGRAHKIEPGEPTVMAMLDCYEPSMSAWRILTRLADGFMIVEEEDAVAVMNRLAKPAAGDPVIISGESGGVGLAGFLKAAADAKARAALGIDSGSRIFVVNSEGATDPALYQELTGVAAPG